jgi:hypothetical protein
MAKHDSIPSPNLPGVLGKTGGLGEKIENVGKRLVAGAFDLIKDGLAHVVRFGLQAFLEAIEPELIDMYGPLLKEVADSPEAPASIKHAINTALSGKYEGGAGVLGSLGMAAGSTIMGNVLGIVMSGLSYELARRIQPFRLDFRTGWSIKRRRPDFAAQWFTDLRDQGWSEARIMAADDVAQTRLGPGELGQLFLRGGISESTFTDEMIKSGFDGNAVAGIKELLQLVPGVNDLISMGVREAWDDRFAELAGTDQELPGDLVTWAMKQGLSAEWVRRYWRAHWQLPSAQMGFEMLHRSVIDRSDLDKLLKALDISPLWREKLTKIAYSPYTRVDTRRMYNLQIINRDGVKRAYLDQGYDEEHAENLTEFTVRDATGGDTEATKSDILSGYSTGMLSKAEALDWLMGLDYPRNIAEFYLANQDAKKAEARKTKRTAAIKKLYIGGEITSAEASTRLTGLGLAGGEITESLDDWQIEHDAKTERPSASQLETFLKQDIIDESKYRDGLKALGFQTQYVEMFAASTLAEKAEAARKSTLAARAEQERLRTAREKTEYAVSTAQINVDEAELATAIAETQVAISARTLRYKQDATLAAKKVSVATLQQQAQSDITALQANIDERNETAKFLQETIATEKSAISDVQLEIAERAAALDAALKLAVDAAEISQLKSDAKTALLESNCVIAEHNTVIAQTQSDLAVNSSQITALQSSINDRRAKLTEDLQIAARIKSSIEIETEYQSDLQTMNNTLSTLRIQQSKLREAKAALSAQLQSSLKTGG